VSLTIEYQADLPHYLDTGLIFEHPHEHSMIDGQRALYRMHGTVLRP
jgi:hypothetical protein